MASSLATFDESDPKAFISSPRSLRALKNEGVLPSDILYKPIEAFQERNLSPRLVKLRYDFFEAKRRDLLAAARRARDALVAEDKREAALTGQALDVMAKESGLSKGAILALSSDGLREEKKKLMRAQERERSWLKGALDMELKQLKLLEEANVVAQDQDNSRELRQQDAARKMKELSDRKAELEERKQLEADARMRLEKQIAKEEYLKQQQERERKAAEDARRQKEAYQRQCEEMARKKQAEVEKQERKEAAFREQEARKAEMQAQDLRRMDVMVQQKQAFQEKVEKKKDERQTRAQRSADINNELELRRREEFEEKQLKEREREDRLMSLKAMDQEETAKKSFQMMMKRKIIFEESNRKQEDRRTCILLQQEDTEMRLLEHEQKKERYLDFKRELDSLKTRNKEINVERQRRREAAARENAAEQVRKKDEKIDALNSERKRLWQIRKDEQTNAYKARESVRAEIMKQRIQSKYNSKLLEQKMQALALKTPTSASMPDLHKPGFVRPLAISADQVDPTSTA